MKIAIFTAVWNRCHILEEALPKIYANSRSKSYAVHHFVGDNGSTDGATDFLREYSRSLPDMRVFYECTNLGKSGILRKIEDEIDLDEYDVYVNCDQDIVPPRGWITKIIKVLRNLGGQGFGLLGPQYKPIKEYPASRHYQAPQNKILNVQHFQIHWGGGLCGGAFFCWVKDWRKIGGYSDLGTFSFGDDVDLCRKSRRVGLKTGVVQEITVLHLPPTKQDAAYMAWKNRQQDQLGALLREAEISVPEAAKLLADTTD